MQASPTDTSSTESAERVGVAFVGCGYSADFYGATIPNYPIIRLVGAYDIVADRATSFATAYGGRAYSGMAELLADPEVRIVVNLTPVAAHDAVNRAALAAGKHVYSEKPLATTQADARSLVTLAQKHGLLLSSAPATIFSRCAQTLIQSVRGGRIGTPRLVYATLDMGPLAFMAYRDWRSPRGVPWPYRDEVGNGCVLEHAGYLLTWLVAMFGPVRQMASHTQAVFPEEWRGVVADAAAEFATGYLRFASGVGCRITVGWAAPEDKSLVVIGDQGVLTVPDVWQASSPVILRRRVHTEGRDTGYLASPEQVPFVLPALPHRYEDAHDLTVSAGIADLAQAVLHGGQPVLNAEYALHVLDVSLRLAAGGTRMDDLRAPDLATAGSLPESRAVVS